MEQILIALAGLMGAAGIVLTAASAHGKPGSGLDSAGYLLLLHAAAIIAGVAAAHAGLLMRPLATLALGASCSVPDCLPPTSPPARILAADCSRSRRQPAASSRS